MNCKRGEKERNRAKKFEWEREENIHLNSGRFDRAMSVPRSLEELERLQPVHAQQVAVELKSAECLLPLCAFKDERISLAF